MKTRTCITIGILAGLLCLGLTFARPACAQTPSTGIGCFDAANSYCLVPTVAVGWQLNLRTGGAANAVSLVGLAVQHQFGSLPLGLGLYGGLGASTANQTSYQGCLGVSITNWGMLCGGAQRATFQDGATAYQAMLTFAGQLTYGGSPSAVRQVAKDSTQAAKAAQP